MRLQVEIAAVGEGGLQEGMGEEIREMQWMRERKRGM